MNLFRKAPHLRAVGPRIATLIAAGTLASGQSGCLSSAEIVNTDRTYLLGPKTESEPGRATRTATAKPVNTRGTFAFHLDRARECTVTSTPRYQRVHIQGRVAKNLTASLVVGSLLTATAGGLIAGSTILDDGQWTRPEFAGSTSDEFTGAGILGLTGIIVGICGLLVLPRAIYHAAVSGTEVTPQDIQFGVPPKGAVLAPKGYDPKDPQVSALVPLAEHPRYGILDLGVDGGNPLRSGSRSLRATAGAEPISPSNPAFLAMPQASGGGGADDDMRACVTKYTPACQSKCGSDKACVLTCLRKPCVDDLEKEVASGGGEQDENTAVITRTETCERSADNGVALGLLFKDTDGVPKTLGLGKTDVDGDLESDVLAGIESLYPGWPQSKQALTKEAVIVLVDDPSTVLGRVDLEKYPALKYAEHVQSTKKAREAFAVAEAARREREARERQAMLEAAAKAADDAAHAGERKAEAAAKAAACVQQAQSRCNADCQGNSACAKKCMQKVSCR